jgi:hypothetical protein
VIAAVGTARALYGMARTRDPGFLLFVVYGFIHVFVVKPVSIYALFTMHRTHWGTRSAGPSAMLEPRPARTRAELSANLLKRFSGDQYEIDGRQVAGSMMDRRRLLCAATLAVPGAAPDVEVGALERLS